MTETEQTMDHAPWPVPDGTLIDPVLEEVVGSFPEIASLFERGVMTLLDKRALVIDAEDADALREVWMHDLARTVDQASLLIEKITEVRRAAAIAFCKALPFPAPSNVSYADCRPMLPRFPKNRTAWDNAALAMDVRAKILEKVAETFVVSEHEAILAAAEVAMGQTEAIVTLSGNHAKTTGIKALGLDPDDYCTSEKQDPDLQVVK